MPIYEYLCLKCGHQFDNLELPSESGNAQCPHCESYNCEKLLSAHGGYQMSSGGGSTRPKSAGSFRSKKK